jgi:hypothetical protein
LERKNVQWAADDVTRKKPRWVANYLGLMEEGHRIEEWE